MLSTAHMLSTIHVPGHCRVMSTLAAIVGETAAIVSQTSAALGAATFAGSVYGTTDMARNASLLKLIKEPITSPVRLVPPESYIPIPGIVQPLEEAMTAQDCGVHVLCLPFDGGKTTAVCRVANYLSEQKRLCGSLYVDLSASPRVSSRGRLDDIMRAVRQAVLPVAHAIVPIEQFPLATRLQQELDIRDLDNCFPVVPDSDCGGPRTVLILDNADSWFQGSDASLACVRHLATESVRTKNFSVIVLCRSPHVAEQVLGYNGKMKIHIVHPRGGMDASVAAAIVERYAAVYPFKKDTVKEYFIQRAAEAAAPGFLVNNVNWVRNITDMAIIKRGLDRALRPYDEASKLVEEFQREWTAGRLVVTPAM